MIKEDMFQDYKFSTQTYVLPTFELVKSKIKLVYQKAFFISKPKINQCQNIQYQRKK